MITIPSVTPEQLKEALPTFRAGLTSHTGATPLSLPVKVRCAVVNYLLYGNGELLDRVCNIVSTMPMDVNNIPQDDNEKADV